MMPVVIAERNTSRAGERYKSQTLEYVVTGTADESEVQDEVEATIPAFFNGLIYDTYSYEPEGDDSTWHVTVKYRKVNGRDGTPAPGEARFFWGSSGENTLVTYPLSTITRNGGSTQYEGIGDDGEQLNGVEIIVPKFTFGYEYTIPAASCNSTYLGYVSSLVGKVNNATFQGFAQGEVLMTSARGSVEYGYDSTVTYEFAYSPNVAHPATIGGVAMSQIGTTGLAKRGWHYLDVHTQKKVTSGVLHIEITQIDVLEVYPEGNFTLLSLP